VIFNCPVVNELAKSVNSTPCFRQVGHRLCLWKGHANDAFEAADYKKGDEETMQAVTMTRELVMAEAAEASVATAKLWARRIAMGAMLAVGIAATVYILGHMGALVVYGLPAPFLRRVPVPAVEPVAPSNWSSRIPTRPDGHLIQTPRRGPR
jgi:hypothetical protein